MNISDVLRRKPGGVVTIRPEDSVEQLLGVLAEHKIGALVVSVDGKSVAGIVSERDVVRHLHSAGAAVLSSPVSSIMTAEVISCEPDEDLAHLAQTMTEQRIRHMPVMSGGELYAIVSIGDVVKSRIDTLQAEAAQLRDYIQG